MHCGGLPVSDRSHMTAAEIRQSFLDYFAEKGHTVVPSASLLPQSPGLLFTNAGMNQFVPYFLGTQKAPYDPPRAVDTQKCIRAGGKHNDLEDVGQDSYHHTFFEMLGNWSFGDYFKEEAIHWAWELLVERWGLPPGRLYATVYRPGPGDPSEFDHEAYDHWRRLFEQAGRDPRVHVVDGTVKDNFWMMGDTGPCGPCSELHIDLTPAGDTRGTLVNKDTDDCIEIWNLVFIQFNADADGTFRELPARHVDTGMGFERACSVIQNTEGFTDFSRKPSNYNTDLFRPVFARLEELCGERYLDVYPEPGRAGHPRELRHAIAFRVIADHVRTLAFSIADGILPGNTGRNYVLRRILRRAVRYGRELGFTGGRTFLPELVGTLAREMGGAFPELRDRAGVIRDTLEREENSFNETLDRGLKLYEEEAAKVASVFPGETAFKLYDTYGFPIDLTQLLCRERGLRVDMERYDELLDGQKRRAREARESEGVSALEIATKAATGFVGFAEDECEATVLEEHSDEELLWIIPDRTPLYAEMGGQVGDTGTIVVRGNEIPVVAVRQIGAARAHGVPGNLVGRVRPGDRVVLKVDPRRRRRTEAHHTATHLLHWALHEVVSPDASQQGSLVAEDRLRFDFSSGPVDANEVAALEERVNACIAADDAVSWREAPFAEVRARRDIMQFFGDKYGENVRVVQIGGAPQALDGYSMELCGGTHVRRTGEIGLFKIRKEEAIAAGVRRIEAACGEAARSLLEEQTHALAGEIKAAKAKLAAANARLEEAGAPPVVVGELPPHTLSAVVEKSDIREINALLDRIETHRNELKQAAAEAEKRLKKAQAAAAGRLAEAHLAKLLDSSTTHLAADFEGPPNLLQELLNGLKKRGFAGAAFLVVDDGERLHLGAWCGPETALEAGALIRELAPLAGGKGGGKPDLARGAAPQRDQRHALLEAARTMISQ